MAAKHSHVYTLLAYRPNGADYCGGYCYGSSESEFSTHIFTDADALARQWARLRMTASKNTGREFQETEFTLLVDGMDEGTWWEVHSEAYDRGEWTEAPHCELRRTADKAYAALREEEARLEAERQAAKERAAAEESRRAQEQAEQAERETYAKLHAKYGNA